MDAVFLAVGSALVLIGYGVERRQPPGFNRGKAVGLTLFVVGDILLFAAGWWWGLMGLTVPPLLIDVVIAAVRRP